MKWLIRVGLGALTIGVGGMAWGQGSVYNDIPAPDLYGEITGCESTTPMSVLAPAPLGPNAGKSTLDLAFGEGTAALTGITAGMLTPCATNTNSVSEGIGQARILHREADQARRGAMVEGASDDAIDDYETAKAERDAYGGAVYDKVYAESAANAAAAKAITDYNALFAMDDANTADVDESGVYTKAVTAFNGVVINNLDTATDFEAEDYLNTYGRDAIRGFQAITAFDTATAAEYDAAQDYTWGAAFDATGNLTFVQEDEDAVRDSDGNITTRNNGAAGSTTITNLGELRAHLDSWNELVTATAKAVTDTDPTTADPTVVARINRDAARAVVARDHVQAEWERLTNVVRRVDRTTGDTSDSDRLDAFDMAQRAVSRAETSVRSTMATLEAATSALSNSLTSADDFLSQVHSSAIYAQNQLDDDATDREIMAAAQAVTDAQEALTAHMALTGDADNPAVGLLNALLEPDSVRGADNPADDDGQALLNAISSNYATAKDAKDAADAAAAAVSGLTGDEGTIADIQTKLAAKKEYIETLAGEIGINPMTGEGTADEDGNTRIDLNEMRSMANSEAIATNSGNIATNSTHILENRGMIEANTGMIMTNSGNIAANAENIMANTGNIAANAANITTNTGNIAANNMYIMENRSMIEANSANIMAVHGMASQNAADIATNAGGIAQNRGMIGDNYESIQTLKAGVAASIALAGMPEIGDRGVSVGAGSYDGETALAVGVHFSGENSRFKLGISSADGETGASVGAGWSF